MFNNQLKLFSYDNCLWQQMRLCDATICVYVCEQYTLTQDSVDVSEIVWVQL